MESLGWVVGVGLLTGMAACSRAEVSPSPRWSDPPRPASYASAKAQAAGETDVCLVRSPPAEPRAVSSDGDETLLASLGGPAAPLVAQGEPAGGAKLTRLARLSLESTARAEGIESAPAPGLVGAELREGQRASMPVSIAPGACVTYVAQGGLGAAQIEAFLTIGAGPDAGRAAPPRVLARSESLGSIAVIGGRSGCVRGPKGGEPWKGELHVKMRRGEGLVLVQTYAL